MDTLPVYVPVLEVPTILLIQHLPVNYLSELIQLVFLLQMISEDENEIPDTILAIVDIISSFSAQ